MCEDNASRADCFEALEYLISKNSIWIQIRFVQLRPVTLGILRADFWGLEKAVTIDARADWDGTGEYSFDIGEEIVKKRLFRKMADNEKAKAYIVEYAGMYRAAYD